MIGNDVPSAMYHGTNEITRMYEGTVLKWSKPEPPRLIHLIDESFYVSGWYSLNINNGAATRISNSFSWREGSTRGMTYHSNVLYLVGEQRDALFSVNASNGSQSQIGSQSRFGNNVRDPQALASHGGVLYLSLIHI